MTHTERGRARPWILPALLLAVSACTGTPDQSHLIALDVRDIARRTAPVSAAQGLALDHNRGGDRDDGTWVQMDAYSGDMTLEPDELPGFADRFCTELGRQVGTMSELTGSLDGGPMERTVSSADRSMTTVEPNRYCAFRITRGWVGAHLVILDEPSRAFLHVTSVQF